MSWIFGIATVLADLVTEISIEYRIPIVILLFAPLLLFRILLESGYATECLVQYGLRQIESNEQLYNQMMRLREGGLRQEDVETFIQDELEELDHQGVPERLYQELKDNPPSIKHE